MRAILGLGVAVVLGVGGCSSSSKDDAAKGGPKGTGETASATIGKSGGVLAGPGGLILTVPPDALTADTKITAISTAGSPPAPFASWNSPVFQLTPEGVAFATPATLMIPFSGSPTGPTLFWSSDSGATFDPLPSTVIGSSVSASIPMLGFGFVGAGATVTPPGDDKCGPYVGSFAGILAFQWSAYDAPAETCGKITPRSGTGTVTVHFTTTCLGPTPAGTLVLNVTTVSTDDKYFQTQFPSPADSTYSQVNMPPNPPTTGAGGISLGFKHGVITMGPTVTVTTGAAKISSDVATKNGWQVLQPPGSGDPDDAAFIAAGMPAGNCAKVDSSTFKIDKL